MTKLKTNTFKKKSLDYFFFILTSDPKNFRIIVKLRNIKFKREFIKKFMIIY